MKVPVQNVYYLLCYAWDKLAERDVVAVDALESTKLVDLFARVLRNGTYHLLKRGFDRGYVPHRDWLVRLRGRISFQDCVHKAAGRTTYMPCEFDELSYDVLHNQILKATMRRLVHTGELAHELVQDLAALCRRFSDVQDIDLSARHFGQVQLHRNNQFYDFLLKVCELVHYNLLVSEKSGHSKFRDFVQDRRQMAILFESFVRNFFRIHTHYTVKREDIKWPWFPVDAVSAALLPKMQTDISLTSANRKIIIECKFTPEATQRHFEAETLRSGHLYQIHAYLTNLPPGKLADTCEMILLYPTVESPVCASYCDKEHKISIRTINLNQEWSEIHKDLVGLVA